MYICFEVSFVQFLQTARAGDYMNATYLHVCTYFLSFRIHRIPSDCTFSSAIQAIKRCHLSVRQRKVEDIRIRFNSYWVCRFRKRDKAKYNFRSKVFPGFREINVPMLQRPSYQYLSWLFVRLFWLVSSRHMERNRIETDLLRNRLNCGVIETTPDKRGICFDYYPERFTERSYFALLTKWVQL